MNQRSSSSSPSQSRPGFDSSERDDRSGAEGEGRGLTAVASDFAGQATRSAEQQFSSGKERAAQFIGQFAEALRHTSKTLSAGADSPAVDDYLGRTATRVEGLSDYVQTKSLSDMVGDVERFARKEPLLFVGSALVLGVLGGRFLKSSQSGRASASVANGQGARAGR